MEKATEKGVQPAAAVVQARHVQAVQILLQLPPPQGQENVQSAQLPLKGTG